MSSLPDSKIYTVKDLYDLPEGQRAELIDGMIYNMGAPSVRHQLLLFALSRKIADHIDHHGDICKVIPAPLAVFLNGVEDPYNYVEPDISVICDPDKLDDKGCNGAPDWVIEIVSPSSRNMDYLRKLVKYQTSGVREYWIVDPDKNIVTVYNYEDETMEQYNFKDEIPVGIYEDFRLSVE